MPPTSNQPARLYGTAKMHIFASQTYLQLRNLNFSQLLHKLAPTTYNIAHVIAEYLKPLADENPYIIRNMQDFPSILKQEPQLETDKEYLFYDLESLFTSIPVRETINYILAEIYDH